LEIFGGRARLATNKLQCPAVPDFYKRACKNEEFRFIKRFSFSKIEEVFAVKLKMISVDHYFRPHQTLKITKNIFQKTFYTEINEESMKY
jgi:hypothetical protein